MIRPIIPVFHDGRARFLTFEAADNLNPLKADTSDIKAWIDARDPIPSGSWREMGGEEFARSFTAARTTGYSIIEDLYDAFRDTINADGTEEDFAALVLPTLRQKGWLAGENVNVAERVRLIYDTNLRLAQGSGRWARYQKTKAAFPYLRGVTARDERVRQPPRSKIADHRAFDGIILPIDHWFWKRAFVPLYFRCRCSVIQMTRSQLARFKGGITSDDDAADRLARIGPTFAPPASFDAQLSAMVTTADANRIPGMPPVDLIRQRQVGLNAWTANLAGQAAEELGNLINSILGIAA